MKIEKVNDHQIRCTLSKTELEKRDLKLSEIAYGNDKVKSLFHDMMMKASRELGFEAENVPLMIEVIPFEDRAVVLITKVEDPEELDTHFSRFAPSILGDEEMSTFNDFLENLFDLNDDNKKQGILPVLAEMARRHAEALEDKEVEVPLGDAKSQSCCFHFLELKDVIMLASKVSGELAFENSLYRNTDKDNYILILSIPPHQDPDFYQICHLATEYGEAVNDNGYFPYFVKEHYEPILLNTALQELRSLSV